MATVKEVSANLKIAQELFKESAPPISQLAKDALDTIESQQAFIDLVGTLPNCNDCFNKFCCIRPQIGTVVRYNCAFHMPGFTSKLN
jgi:hypothetical protein